MPITARMHKKSFLVVGKIQSELIGTNLPKLFQQKPLPTPNKTRPDPPTHLIFKPSFMTCWYLTYPTYDTSIGIGKFWHCFHFSLYFLFSSCGPWQPFLITPLSPGKATLFSIIGKRPNQAEKFSDTDFLTRSIHEDKTCLLSVFVFWTFDCIFVLMEMPVKWTILPFQNLKFSSGKKRSCPTGKWGEIILNHSTLRPNCPTPPNLAFNKSLFTINNDIGTTHLEWRMIGWRKPGRQSGDLAQRDSFQCKQFSIITLACGDDLDWQRKVRMEIDN